MPVYPLVVLALLAAFTPSPLHAKTAPDQATALDETAGPCPFFYGRDVSDKAGMPLKGVECEAARVYEQYFHALREAADIRKEELTFARSIDDSPNYNAYYYNGMRVVRITRGFVQCSRFLPEVAVQSIAHEIGHAVQEKTGDLKLRESEFAENSRRVEGQADQIGRELVLLARIPISQAEVNDVKMNCLARPHHYLSNYSHPANVVRWNAYANADRNKSALAAANDRIARSLGTTRFEDWRGSASLSKNAPGANDRTLYTLGGFTWRDGDYRPSVAAADYDEHGLPPSRATDVRRMRQSGIDYAFTVPTELKTPGSTALLKLPGGSYWFPPASPLTPAEMLIFTARHALDGTISEMPPDRAFVLALDYMMRNDAWELLPGSVFKPTASRVPPVPVEIRIKAIPTERTRPGPER